MDGSMFQKYKNRIKMLEAEKENLQCELLRKEEKLGKLKALLSEEHCMGTHCGACKNYYSNGFSCICILEIKCKDFKRRNSNEII